MTLIAYIPLLAAWGCACCWESDECVVGRHGLICWQDWHTEWEGELGESGRKLLAAEQGWHHQSWYNQSSGCKRALQSRAEGLGYVSPPEVMHSAVSPACSAWGGFGGILGGPFDVAFPLVSRWTVLVKWDWSAVGAEPCEPDSENEEWRQTKAPATANDLHTLHGETESEQDKS